MLKNLVIVYKKPFLWLSIFCVPDFHTLQNTALAWRKLFGIGLHYIFIFATDLLGLSKNFIKTCFKFRRSLVLQTVLKVSEVQPEHMFLITDLHY